MSSTPRAMDQQNNLDPKAPPPPQQQAQVTQTGPNPNPNERRGSGGQRPPRMVERVYYVDTCCCDCPWNQAVGWVAGIEFTWGVIMMIISISCFITGNAAKARRSRGDSSFTDPLDDQLWGQFYDDHYAALIISIVLHSVEFIISIFIMVGASQRNRGFCYFWIVAVILVSGCEIAVVAYDQFGVTWAGIAFLPLRVYFLYIVLTLAVEIKKYPAAPPVRRVLEPAPTIISPTYVAAPPYVVGYPGYGYPYGGMGYGYGYPYYGGYGGYYGDPALTGFALGAGMGMGMGGGCYDSCDYGGGGGFYDSNF